MNAPVDEQWDHRETVIDFDELLKRLWAGRWWIAASVLLLTAAAGAAAFLMTPVYRATTVLVPASTERASLSNSLGSALGSLGGLAALAGVNLNAAGSATEETLAVLRSRQFAESFIRDKNLMPEFFPGRWDESAARWKVSIEKQPTAAQAFKYFDRKVRSVSQDKKTGLVTLQIDWKRRDVAAEWANELVRRLNAEMQRRAIRQADASLGFLQKELSATTVLDTRNAINRLIEIQINQRMVANVTGEYAFRVVDPAMAADRGDVIRPRKLLMLVMGAFSGFLIGVVAVFLLKRAT